MQAVGCDHEIEAGLGRAITGIHSCNDLLRILLQRAHRRTEGGGPTTPGHAPKQLAALDAPVPAVLREHRSKRVGAHQAAVAGTQLMAMHRDAVFAIGFPRTHAAKWLINERHQPQHVTDVSDRTRPLQKHRMQAPALQKPHHAYPRDTGTNNEHAQRIFIDRLELLVK